ncbi:ArsR family transcriptional regulator [Candidatus Bathyarchaeota archaeon A05DMB-2]|jgi:uncharacterized RDD family membrane protein YckC/DNA-binding transcriptional ArsR family regulator|nr:ArsR family transcriptional regulator [Candidatus Bathyarchaeota archaeon A05DMB-2]
MAVEQQNVSKILSVLSHPLRREILLTLSDKSECSFTDLLNILKIDTGKLSFHLRALSAFVEQTPMAKYRLSRAGENAVRVIKDVESWAEAADVEKKATYLPLASFRKRAYAFLIDFSLILAITLVIMLPQVISFLSGNVFTIGLSAIIFGTLGLLWVYSTLLEGFNGQSLGKRIIGLKVVRTDGKKATYDQAAVRNFGKAFLLPVDLIAGLRIKNAEFLRYFDRFAGTTVIDLRH